RSLIRLIAKKQIPPAPRPIRMEAGTVTKPDAGVIATRPATAPAAAPSTLGRLCTIQLTLIQVSAAIAAAVLVTTKALAASPPDVSAEPALKPNQPNHSRPAPRTTIVRSCGSNDSSFGNPLRRPRTTAATSADAPLVMCTTVPPAKSSIPRLCNQPPV